MTKIEQDLALKSTGLQGDLSKATGHSHSVVLAILTQGAKLPQQKFLA